MDKQGFSLIEVIVAFLILVLTAGGVLHVFCTETSVVMRTGHRMQAMDFARQTLEELKNAVAADTWESDDQAVSELAVGKTYSRDLPIVSELKSKFPRDGDPTKISRDYIVESVDGVDPVTGYRKVSVTVYWEEPEGN